MNDGQDQPLAFQSRERILFDISSSFNYDKGVLRF